MATKPHVTKTLGPLHLEDLEPHRFEDLVRQLLYDFRDWKELEATGRGGSDDGFDVRGTEAHVYDNAPGSEPEADEDETSTVLATEERQWLIQCKREKSIGPRKLTGYLNDLTKTDLHPLGILGIFTSTEHALLISHQLRLPAEARPAMAVVEVFQHPVV